MRRNSNALFLDTGYEKIPVPLRDGSPDFSGFPEQLQVELQQIWQTFLDSEEVLEAIPELEAVSLPDWSKFNQAMLNSSFIGWLESFPETHRIVTIQYALGQNLQSLQSFYNLLAKQKSPSETEVTEWQSIADEFNVPLVF